MVERLICILIDIKLQVTKFTTNLIASPAIRNQLRSITNLNAFRDNCRLSCLTMDLSQTSNRNNLRCKHILEDVAHTDTLKLSVITNHDKSLTSFDCLNQIVEQLSTNHRGLIQNDDILL